MHPLEPASTRPWRRRPAAVALSTLLLAAGCATGPEDGPVSGDLPTGQALPLSATRPVAAAAPAPFARQAVAAANPLAAQAGLQVLREGGSALDAAIAVQMVLSVVEPQASGIGGGALMLHWDGQRVQAYDGREMAPGAADEGLFLQEDGQPLPFTQAVVGGRAVGVPGAVAMLELAHRRHGRLPWARLFEPAIRLAAQGFAVSPLLHRALAQDRALRANPQAAAFWFDRNGTPWPAGHVLKNPALARVLGTLARQGSRGLHEGAVAADIVRRVQGHPANPGRLTLQDLDGYVPKEREPLCTLWKARWRVCGFPPPSSGHLALMQILGILERLPAPSAAPLEAGLPGPDFLHAYTEAARLAFADRAAYVGDPDYVPAPGGQWTTLLDGEYLARRAAMVKPVSMKAAKPGRPGPLPLAWAPMPEQPEHGTSHVSIVDAQGRAVALTTTIEATWGARLMSDGGTGLPGGFMLNNQLTDFAFVPQDAQGRPVANRVQPGKRPRSSMSPTLVFDARDNRLLMSLGSPGGAGIIHYTAKTLLATLDWQLTPQAAVALPNFASMNGPTLLEAGLFPPATVAALRARGHEVAQQALDSGIQVLQRDPGGWLGGADPRREGTVLGD